MWKKLAEKYERKGWIKKSTPARQRGKQE